GVEDQVPRLVPGRRQFQVVVDVLAVLEPAQGVSDLVLGAGPGAAAAGQPDRRGNRGADGGGGRHGSCREGGQTVLPVSPPPAGGRHTCPPDGGPDRRLT